MSIESVNILVVDKQQPPSPISGVTAKILTEDGRGVIAQMVTGEDGLIGLLLEEGTYQARFFKFGVTFQGAVLLQVTGGDNSFRVQGAPYVYPSATDPRLCIAAGFFRSPTGGVGKWVDLHFIPKWSPLLLDGSPIMTERVSVRTDEKGYVELPLIRFGQYDVTIEGMEDYQRTVSVPDSPSVNIGDLLFPVVSSVSFDEAGPYQMVVGQPLVLRPHVFSSDGNELPDISRDVLWSTTDSSKLGLSVGKDSLTLNAYSTGVLEVFAARRDKSIVRIPNTLISGVPISVTVS